jgi:hypothetical protein
MPRAYLASPGTSGGRYALNSGRYDDLTARLWPVVLDKIRLVWHRPQYAPEFLKLGSSIV